MGVKPPDRLAQGLAQAGGQPIFRRLQEEPGGPPAYALPVVGRRFWRIAGSASLSAGKHTRMQGGRLAHKGANPT